MLLDRGPMQTEMGTLKPLMSTWVMRGGADVASS